MVNPFEYIKSIQNQWAWQPYCDTKWVKINKSWVLKWNLSTGGLSVHEQIIADMDTMFWTVCCDSSRRGGHYVLSVTPEQWGYKLVNDYAREKGISRQYIYHNPEKFEWVHVSKGVKFIKPTTPSKNKSNTER